MLDKISGRVAYAVISSSGFLGLAADEFAAPWSVLDYDTSLEGYRTAITKERLRTAPSLSLPGDQAWPDREREQDLHDYYGVSYYWIAP